MKQLQESTDQGLYYLQQPGTGDRPPFIADPHITLQKWGANLRTNSVNLENDLRGMNQPLSRDYVHTRHSHITPTSHAIPYPTIKSAIVQQPRATHPAWTARDLEQTNWWVLPLNPQKNVIMPFHNNIATRILEKDHYMPCALPESQCVDGRSEPGTPR